MSKIKGKSKEGPSNKLAIAIAIFGLIGTVVTAYFGYRGAVEPSKIIIAATQTAEARQPLPVINTDTLPAPADKSTIQVSES